MTKTKFSMNQAMKKLEEINDWFQNEEIDLDEGLSKLEEAQKLTKQIRDRLSEVENKFTELKEDFSN